MQDDNTGLTIFPLTKRCPRCEGLLNSEGKYVWCTRCEYGNDSNIKIEDVPNAKQRD